MKNKAILMSMITAIAGLATLCVHFIRKCRLLELRNKVISSGYDLLLDEYETMTGTDEYESA